MTDDDTLTAFSCLHCSQLPKNISVQLNVGPQIIDCSKPAVCVVPRKWVVYCQFEACSDRARNEGNVN